MFGLVFMLCMNDRCWMEVREEPFRSFEECTLAAKQTLLYAKEMEAAGVIPSHEASYECVNFNLI